MESSDLENHLACPICLEIPRYEIIQCKNGHHICKGCQKSLANCPQCRMPYGNDNVRNLAMESLLDAMKFHCPFKKEGCPAKLPRKDLDTHDSSCKFSPVTKLFCSRILGWKDCKATVDHSSVVPHLKQHHPVKTVNYATFQIGIEYRELSPIENADIYFDPVVVTSLTTPILLRTVMTRFGHIVLTCFMFRDSEMADVETESFRVKYLIQFDKEADIEWSGHVQSYRKFEKIADRNSFYVRAHSAEDRIDEMGASTIAQPVQRLHNINIKVAIYKATDIVPSLKSGILQKVNISEQFSLPYNGRDTMLFYIHGRCNVCRTHISDIRYQCIQCPTYDLCSKCMGQGHHSQHILVRFHDIEQSTTFYNEYGRRYNRIETFVYQGVPYSRP